MKHRSVAPMKIAKYGYFAVSVIFCLVGILMTLMPTPSAMALGIFFGTAMIIFGVIKLVGYFSKDLFRLAFQYDLQFGILLILMGVITLVRPGNVINFICVSLGIFTIADCLFKTKIAFEAKRFGIRSWWLTFSLAIVTGIVGILLAFRPSDMASILVFLLGLTLLAEGILNLSVAASLVKIVKHQKPDYIDADYYEIREER